MAMTQILPINFDRRPGTPQAIAWQPTLIVATVPYIVNNTSGQWREITYKAIMSDTFGEAATFSDTNFYAPGHNSFELYPKLSNSYPAGKITVTVKVELKVPGFPNTDWSSLE